VAARGKPGQDPVSNTPPFKAISLPISYALFQCTESGQAEADPKTANFIFLFMVLVRGMCLGF
jgi:hypothetical protein